MNYRPLAPDQIGANIVGVATGYRAHRNGASAMQTINVGLHWRYWYKNLTWSILLLVLAGLATTAYWWVLPAQAVVTVFVMGVTYASLIDWSPGFKQRFAYRVFAPIQHAMPNVARFWWYLVLLLPLWSFLWFMFAFRSHPGYERQP